MERITIINNSAEYNVGNFLPEGELTIDGVALAEDIGDACKLLAESHPENIALCARVKNSIESAKSQLSAEGAHEVADALGNPDEWI